MSLRYCLLWSSVIFCRRNGTVVLKGLTALMPRVVRSPALRPDGVFFLFPSVSHFSLYRPYPSAGGCLLLGWIPTSTFAVRVEKLGHQLLRQCRTAGGGLRCHHQEGHELRSLEGAVSQKKFAALSSLRFSSFLFNCSDLPR